MTLYEKMAIEINERFAEFSALTFKEVAEILNRKFESNTQGATVHTIMMGVKGTREYMNRVMGA